MARVAPPAPRHRRCRGEPRRITTFNEIQTSLLVISSIGLVLPGAAGELPRPGHNLLAGMIMGLAVGLKLTATIYLVAALLLAGQPISHVVPLRPGGNRRFIGVNWWSSAEGPRREAAIETLAKARGMVWALILRDAGGETSIEQLGWEIEETGCTPVHTSLRPTGIDLCPVVPQMTK